MWPLNFLALAVAVVVVALRAEPVRSIPVLVVLGLSVECALGWACTFYVPHSLGTSATLLSSAAVLTWVLLALSARAVPWTGWLLTPYALWMTVATSLAVFWILGGATGRGPEHDDVAHRDPLRHVALGRSPAPGTWVTYSAAAPNQ